MSRLKVAAEITNKLDAQWASIRNRLVDKRGQSRKKTSPMRRARIEKDLLDMIRGIPDLVEVNKNLRRSANEQRRHSS